MELVKQYKYVGLVGDINKAFQNNRDGKQVYDKVRCFCSDVKMRVSILPQYVHGHVYPIYLPVILRGGGGGMLNEDTLSMGGFAGAS